MKKRMALALLAVLGMAVLVQGQPDPRDSIILESKTVVPGARAGSSTDTAAYVYLKVYITNKDTLAAVALSVQEKTLSGGAYMILGRPRTFDGCVSRLTNTFTNKLLYPVKYHSNSPDSFAVQTWVDPLKPTSVEPPNLIRKPFWEIKFDTVFSNLGAIEFDTAQTIHGTGFVDLIPRDVPVNFVKSVVTVGLKGDLNLDGEVRPSDLVLLLQAIYLGEVPPAGMEACDVNCDGQVTAADFTAMLNYKYLGAAWPC